MEEGGNMSENDRLAEIKARCEAATPGPWHGDRYDGSIKYEMRGADDALVLAVDHKNGTFGFLGDKETADEKFVLHSREDVPYLLTEVERLRAENAALAGERDRLREALDAVERANEIGIGPDTIHCRHCRAVCVTSAPLIHEPDCPFAVLNEEPTDAE
jgi:hypothetical protein